MDTQGYFPGDVDVTGNLSKDGGFKIDHPLNPANKCLYRSFLESPAMMNIYNVKGKYLGPYGRDDFQAFLVTLSLEVLAFGGPGPGGPRVRHQAAGLLHRQGKPASGFPQRTALTDAAHKEVEACTALEGGWAL
jgi:hypothetical protein